jgi:DNA invertase Pin-like site-specific DNA recombinase
MATGGGDGAPSFVPYYRVSTDRQGASGLGLEAQKATVIHYITSAHGGIVAEYEEIESGSRSDRPQLALALADCRARHATLILAKLDRLARNTSFLLSVPQLPPGPAGTFMLTMFAAVAELERGLISQRTKAALAALKARGIKLGGPNLARGFDAAASRAGRAARTAIAIAHGADVLPYITDARRAGAVSNPKIAAALTARGIRPPSGGDRGHANQVRRIVAAGAPAFLAKSAPK